MTGCKIGKVKFKTGCEVRPIKNTNMTLHTGKEWIALNNANKLVREGNARAVLVTVIQKDGMVYSDFNKHDDIKSTEICGAVEYLRDFTTRWAKE